MANILTFSLYHSVAEVKREIYASREFLAASNVTRVMHVAKQKVHLFIEFRNDVKDCLKLSSDVIDHLCIGLHCCATSFCNREFVKSPPTDALDILLIHTNSNFKWRPLTYDDYNTLGVDGAPYRINGDPVDAGSTAASASAVPASFKSIGDADVACSSMIFAPCAESGLVKREAMWLKWMDGVGSEYEKHGADFVADQKGKTEAEMFENTLIVRKYWTKSVLQCQFTKLLLSIIPKFAREIICEEWVIGLMLEWSKRKDSIAKKYKKHPDDIASMKWLINYFMFSSTTQSFWHHHISIYNTCDRFGMCLYDVGSPHMSALEMHRRIVRMEKMRFSLNRVVLAVAQTADIFESNEDTDDAREMMSVLKYVGADRCMSQGLQAKVKKMISEKYKHINSDEKLDKISAALLKNRSNAMECVFPIVDEFTWGCTQTICFMAGFPITATTQFPAACATVAARLHAMNELVVDDLRNTCIYGILLHFWIIKTFSMYERFLIMFRDQGMGVEPSFKYAAVHDKREKVPIRAFEFSEHVGCLYTDLCTDLCTEKRRYVHSMYTSIHALVAGFPVRDAVGMLSGDPEKWRIAEEQDICNHVVSVYDSADSVTLLKGRRQAVLQYEAVEREIVQRTQPAFVKVHELLVKYRRFVSALFSGDGHMRNQTWVLPMTSSMFKVIMAPYSFQNLRACAVKYNASTFEGQDSRKALAIVTASLPKVVKSKSESVAAAVVESSGSKKRKI